MTDSMSIPIRRVWLTAVLIGVLSSPLAFLAKREPWVIAIPIVLGTLVVVALVVVEPRRKSGEQLPLIRMPTDFFGLARYKGHVSLFEAVDKDTKKGQATFDFLGVPVRVSHQSARTIRDPDTGERIYLIDTGRFVELFLKHYLPNLDKITEVSTLHALHRYGEMNSMSGELERFFRDKTVLEVLKSDFRGNAAQSINRSSEAALREIVKQAKQGKQPQLSESVKSQSG